MSKLNFDSTAKVFLSGLVKNDKNLLNIIDDVKFTYIEIEIIACLLNGCSQKNISSLYHYFLAALLKHSSRAKLGSRLNIFLRSFCDLKNNSKDHPS